MSEQPLAWEYQQLCAKLHAFRDRLPCPSGLRDTVNRTIRVFDLDSENLVYLDKDNSDVESDNEWMRKNGHA